MNRGSEGGMCENGNWSENRWISEWVNRGVKWRGINKYMKKCVNEVEFYDWSD